MTTALLDLETIQRVTKALEDIIPFAPHQHIRTEAARAALRELSTFTSMGTALAAAQDEAIATATTKLRTIAGICSDQWQDAAATIGRIHEVAERDVSVPALRTLDAPADDALVKAVGDSFAKVLKEIADDAQWADMLASNAAETSAGVCHSHDFCDANLAMAEAFKVHGINPNDAGDDEHATDLWNRAWNYAKAEHLDGEEIMSRTAYRIFEAFAPNTGDKVRWIAAPTEESADAERIKRGWEKGAEQSLKCIPTDPKGLKQMGVDVIVKPQQRAA